MKDLNSNLIGLKALVNLGKPGYMSGITIKAVTCVAFALCLAGCKKDELDQTAELNSSSSKSEQAGTSAVADFTIAVIPDTQYYVSSQHGGTPAMFTKQIDWIKANQVAENIVYVASLGDITDHGNDVDAEWTNASTAGYYKLETQTGFTNGIPYGTCVGNHDQTPNTGHPLTCSTADYNGKFGANRFRPRAYYGENYAGTSSNSNDSHYDLITAGGIDFIIIYTEYDSHGDDGANMNTWAYNLLGTFANRKAIIVSHMMTNASGAWGTTGSTYAQGQVLYNRIKSRPNVIAMFGGHFTGESVREDNYNGNTIRTYLSDYQGRTNGGNGYMRLMKFSVDNNTVSVKTYSPHLGLYETDSNSQFTRPMFGTGVFDDFANGVSHFYRAPSFSGSSLGIGASTATQFVSGSSTHLQVTLNDNTASTDPWRVRLLSGDGIALNNTPTAKTDSIYFWLKTSNAQAGATAKLWIDDSDGTEESSAITIINDGAWHKYAWSLSNFGGVGAVGGNGIIDKPQVTLDAIILSQPNTASQWVSFIDDVGKQ